MPVLCPLRAGFCSNPGALNRVEGLLGRDRRHFEVLRCGQDSVENAPALVVYGFPSGKVLDVDRPCWLFHVSFHFSGAA